MELYQASNQLFNRPEDECFDSLESMHEKTLNRAISEVEFEVNLSDGKFLSTDQHSLGITFSPESAPFKLTAFSAEQLSQDLKVPFSYVNRLPEELALQCLNHGLKSFPRKDNSLALLNTEALEIRTITSQKYSRIYDHEIIKHLIDNLDQDNWGIAPTWDGSKRGLYSGDRDMFIFMINGGSYVTDGFGDLGIHRGFFVRNSEVKASSLEITTFLHRGICGNHIVWGAENVVSSRIRHIGDDAFDKFKYAMNQLTMFTDSSSSKEEENIRTFMNTKLGNNKDETVESVRKMFRTNIIGKKDLESSYSIGEQYADIDSPPNTAWGIANAITRYSQNKYPEHQNKRNSLDRVAGMILDKVIS
jgi:hypothetical protein